MLKKFYITISLMLALTMAACSSNMPAETNTGDNNATTAQTQTTEDTSGDKEKKDEKQFTNYFIVEEPTTLDSSRGSDSASNSILAEVMEPLMRAVENEDHTLSIIPAGAETVEVSEDGLTYTFKLRDNKWSDGVAVTAQDYVYGIRRSLDPEVAGEQGYLIKCIKNASALLENAEGVTLDDLGVSAPDEKTLVIELDYVLPYFTQLTYQRVMLPQRQDIVEANGNAYGSEVDKVVYCGPYKATEWVHNNKLVLQRNEGYWDNETNSFDTVNVPIISDENTGYTAFEVGDVDFVNCNKPEWRAKFEAMENVGHMEFSNPSVRFILFNCQDELFKNEKIRRAFSLALNRDEVTELIFEGVAQPAYGWVTPNISIGDKDYRTEVAEPLLKIKEETADVKALFIEGLKELGMPEDPSQVTIKFGFGGTAQVFKDFGEYLQNSYKESLGVNLEIVMDEWPIFADKIGKGEFQVGFMAWGAEYNDPSSMLFLHTEAASALGTGWVNKEYDELVNKAAVESDPAVRMELFKQAEEILFAESPVCPVNYPKRNFYFYKYYKNIPVHPFANQSSKYSWTEGRSAQ